MNELIDNSSELFEFAIDSFLDDGIIRDFPFVSSILGFYKITRNIRDRIFLKKIQLFLFELDNITANKKNEFLKKLDSDNKFNEKIGETLLLILDKANSFSKAQILGRLFRATIDEKYNYKIFLKLANIIDRCFVDDLEYLIPFYNENKRTVDDEEKDILYNLGLLKNTGISGKTYLYRSEEIPSNKEVKFEINKYGKLIVEYGLNYNVR